VKRFIKIIKSKVYPLIDFKQRHNALYKPEMILDVLTYIAMTNDFTTNGTKTYRLVNGDSPHQNTIWYNLKKLDTKEVMIQFEAIFEKVYQMTKKQRIFEKPVDIAIDITEWMYYGNENDPMVVTTKYKNGTNLCYRFATVNIVEKGRRFTFYALPMSQFASKDTILKKLVEYVNTKVKIKTVYVDRDFFNCKNINLLKEMGVKFLMPAIQNKRIMRLVNEFDSPKVIEYKMGVLRGMRRKSKFREDSSYFKLVIVRSNKNPEKKVVFATNIDSINEKNAQAECDNYGKRWGIETSYRCKTGFRVKTTSKSYVIRLFYFLFSVCFYNLWILVNIFVEAILENNGKKLTITAKIFGTLLYSAVPLDPG